MRLALGFHVSMLMYRVRCIIRNNLLAATIVAMFLSFVLTEEVSMRLISLGLDGFGLPLTIAALSFLNSSLAGLMFAWGWGFVAYEQFLNGGRSFQDATEAVCFRSNPYFPLVAQGGGPLSFDAGDQPARFISFVQWRLSSITVKDCILIMLLARLPTSTAYADQLFGSVLSAVSERRVTAVCRIAAAILGVALAVYSKGVTMEALQMSLPFGIAAWGGGMWFSAHIEVMHALEARRLANLVLPTLPSMWGLPSLAGLPVVQIVIHHVLRVYLFVTEQCMLPILMVHFYVRYGVSSRWSGVPPITTACLMFILIGAVCVARFALAPLFHADLMVDDSDLAPDLVLALPPSAAPWVAHLSRGEGGTHLPSAPLHQPVSALPIVGSYDFQLRLLRLWRRWDGTPTSASRPLMDHCRDIVRYITRTGFEQAPLYEAFGLLKNELQHHGLESVETSLPLIDTLVHIGAVCTINPDVRERLSACKPFISCFESAIAGLHSLALPSTILPPDAPAHRLRLDGVPMSGNHMFIGGTGVPTVASAIYHLFGLADMVLTSSPQTRGIPTCDGGWVPRAEHLPVLETIHRNLHPLLECVLAGEAPAVGEEGFTKGPLVLPPLVALDHHHATHPTINGYIRHRAEVRLLTLRGIAALLLAKYFEASATFEGYFMKGEALTLHQDHLRRVLDTDALCSFVVRHYHGHRPSYEGWDVMVASLTFVLSRRLHCMGSDTLFHSHVTRLIHALAVRSILVKGDEAAIVNGLVGFPWPVGWEPNPANAGFPAWPRGRPHDASLPVSMVIAELCGQPSVWGSTLFDRSSYGCSLLSLSVARCFRGASCQEPIGVPCIQQGVLPRIVANACHLWTLIEHLCSQQAASHSARGLDVFNRTVRNTWHSIYPLLQLLHQSLKSLVYLARIPHHADRPFTCPATPSLSRGLLAKCISADFIKFAERLHRSVEIYNRCGTSVWGRHGVPDPYHILAASGLLKEMWGIPSKGNTISSAMYNEWAGFPAKRDGAAPAEDGVGLPQMIHMLVASRLLNGVRASATMIVRGKGSLFRDIVEWAAELRGLATMAVYRQASLVGLEQGSFDPDDICVVCLDRLGLGTAVKGEEDSDQREHIEGQHRHLISSQADVEQDWHWRLWSRFNTSVVPLLRTKTPSAIENRMPLHRAYSDDIDTSLGASYQGELCLPSAGESRRPHYRCLQQLNSAVTLQTWFESLWGPQFDPDAVVGGGPRHIREPPPPFPVINGTALILLIPNFEFSVSQFWSERVPSVAQLFLNPQYVMRVLPCGHAFHHPCIVDSLLRADELCCPMCRQKIDAAPSLRPESM